MRVSHRKIFTHTIKLIKIRESDIFVNIASIKWRHLEVWRATRKINTMVWDITVNIASFRQHHLAILRYIRTTNIKKYFPLNMFLSFIFNLFSSIKRNNFWKLKTAECFVLNTLKVSHPFLLRKDIWRRKPEDLLGWERRLRTLNLVHGEEHLLERVQWQVRQWDASLRRNLETILL